MRRRTPCDGPRGSSKSGKFPYPSEGQSTMGAGARRRRTPWRSRKRRAPQAPAAPCEHAFHPGRKHHPGHSCACARAYHPHRARWELSANSDLRVRWPGSGVTLWRHAPESSRAHGDVRRHRAGVLHAHGGCPRESRRDSRDAERNRSGFGTGCVDPIAYVIFTDQEGAVEAGAASIGEWLARENLMGEYDILLSPIPVPQ